MTLSYRHPASSESEGKKNMIKACAHSPSWENYVYWDYSKSKSFTQSKSQEKHKAMIMSSIVILSPTSQASLTEKQKYPAHYAGPGVLPLTHSLSQSVIWVCKRHSQWKNGTNGKVGCKLELNPTIFCPILLVFASRFSLCFTERSHRNLQSFVVRKN